ncbi:membrane protein required for colicin V production [Bradyrhizobium sp. S3.3.6]|uniref:CvpA family protein n=1 Tax=Bradyrhizobium cytisi TaxID=515489 RepID=A0A5S4W6E4_9BRAD|nr:CvpA family protein [Bradyrhizobium cytisi]TYL75919.1 CvpA family protein [Bradyrhizobium cytisi]
MNSFDFAVYAALALAIGFGFRTGLLRSAMTILAYLLAAPIAVSLMPMIAPQITGNPNAPQFQNWIWLFGIFLVVGMLLGYIGRFVLEDTVGDAGIGDRLGGAALGAVRVGLVATTLVLVFDQIVPANRQPPFLAGSHLRPLFSAVGQMGFKSLPPEAAAAIDRLKQERRI